MQPDNKINLLGGPYSGRAIEDLGKDKVINMGVWRKCGETVLFPIAGAQCGTATYELDDNRENAFFLENTWEEFKSLSTH